jgi:predicted AAA+ superfamily ATPase
MKLERALKRAPVVALLGPRQCGKTTLARALAAGRTGDYFDLESPRDDLRLAQPERALGRLRGLVVLDEIQRRADIFPVLRVLADRRPVPARFLLLGSASPDLAREVSESLAGRVEHVDLHGFNLLETGVAAADRLWVRGGFPPSFLARTEADSVAWRESFIRTFLERDIPQLGIGIPAPALRRFWTMLAHYHGQVWNASELGRSLGLSDKTVRGYLDVLTATFMARQLQPWHANVGKRQVKAPKVYLRDTGLLHALLDLGTRRALEGHPKAGASWEGFALEQVVRHYGQPPAYFWAAHGSAELDLLLFVKGRPTGFEFKYSETPRVTASMRTALRDLGLEKLYVICPGSMQAELDDRIVVLGLDNIGNLNRQAGRAGSSGDTGTGGPPSSRHATGL